MGAVDIKGVDSAGLEHLEAEPGSSESLCACPAASPGSAQLLLFPPRVSVGLWFCSLKESVVTKVHPSH